MPCVARPIVISTLDTDCIDLSGDGSAGDPLSAAPILDPSLTNKILCGPTGLIAEAGTVSASGVLFVPLIGPAPPGPPGPPIIVAGPINVSITNPTADDIDVVMISTLRNNGFSEGSCAPDLKGQVDIDGGGFIDLTQAQYSNTGAIAADPALGGDGTGNPFGVNTLHISDGDTFVGYNPDSGTPTLGTPLASGATKSIDFQMQFSYLGAWNASRYGFNIATLTLIGMVRA